MHVWVLDIPGVIICVTVIQYMNVSNVKCLKMCVLIVHFMVCVYISVYMKNELELGYK